MGPDRKWGNLLAWTVEVGLEAARAFSFQLCLGKLNLYGCLFFFFFLKELELC